MTRILAVSPSQVGSAASSLELRGSQLWSRSARLELRDGSGRLVQRAYGSTSGTVMDIAGLPRGRYTAMGGDRATLLVEVGSPSLGARRSSDDRLAMV